MELAMAGVIGVLFACGTYLILKPNLIRLVMGFSIYSNAVNLLLITTGGYTRTKDAPFINESDVYSSMTEQMEIPTLAGKLMDPLPPDIILTAIVISFAVGALLLTICYRVYLDHGTDNPDKLPVADLEGNVPGDDDIHGKGKALANSHE
jgi:multicomponent Na+:H+ antiporter subunit C